MKTTRDTLLIVFVSFVSIVQLARCSVTSTLDDRVKETEEIEKLVRKEVITSLRLLSESDNDDVESQTFNTEQYGPSHAIRAGNGSKSSSRYYQLSSNHNPNQEVRDNGNSKRISLNDVTPSAAVVSAMQTREPEEYTTTVTLPSLGVGRLLYGAGSGPGYSGAGGYSAGGVYNGLAGTALRLRPSSLIRRGLRRLGRLGGRNGGGNGLRYGAGGGMAGLVGGAGLQGMNAGFGGGGGGFYDEDSSISLGGNGGPGYYGNGRYGLQGNNGGTGSGGSWTLGDGNALSPNEYYTLRYGYPANPSTGVSIDGTSGYSGAPSTGVSVNGTPGGGVGSSRRYTLSYPNDASNAAVSVDGNPGGGVGSSRRYTLSYPNDASNAAVSVDGNPGGGVGDSRRYTLSYPNDAPSNTVTTADETNPPQYELMFLRNNLDSTNAEIQKVLNGDADSQPTTGTTSGSNRDPSNGTGYRINISGTSGPSTLRRTSTSSPNGVEEYRVVLLNKDSSGNGSGRSGASLSTSSSGLGGSGSGSWTVSSSGSATGGGSGQGAFQITTPITSTQVSIPPTSIIGSVLSSVQGAANGEQTRGLSSSNDSSGGKIIKVIPV